MKTHQRWHGQLFQHGQCVAQVHAHSRDEVRNEIGHYAMMYSQVGPCEVVVKCDKRVIDMIGYPALVKRPARG